ncbi:hypothetical protein NPIL_247301 [Nephila pilipes]|uniref:Uncharacterized protein n=1 Tax=Nephila pilipes TaxID=299642 RepID=A0A8X6PAF0_NEPPI|nr:hypothetical protein NPIL_247301 [Nephila pilipes]
MENNFSYHHSLSDIYMLYDESDVKLQDVSCDEKTEQAHKQMKTHSLLTQDKLLTMCFYLAVERKFGRTQYVFGIVDESSKNLECPSLFLADGEVLKKIKFHIFLLG